jgi:hypothetical protein
LVRAGGLAAAGRTDFYDDNQRKRRAPVRKGSQRVMFGIRTAWAVPAVVWVFALPYAASAGFVVGIEFVDREMSAPAWDTELCLGGYSLTDPSSPFAASGALAGYDEAMLQSQIIAAVQEAFRSAEIGVPGRMLDVSIIKGAVSRSVGTDLLIAADLSGTGLAGESVVGSAMSRPDLPPGSPYTNDWSVTLVNNIAGMPVTYHTASEVVNAVAGTAAHEIAHTLGVENHAPGSAVDGTYPIMASGTSNPPLPTAARLTLRKFLDIPGTEPDGRSVTQVLLDSAGTTNATDFNFDGITDGSDFNILMSNLGRSGTGVKTGDATDDGCTDGSDYNAVMANLGMRADTIGNLSLPEPRSIVLLAIGVASWLAYAWRKKDSSCQGVATGRAHR